MTKAWELLDSPDKWTQGADARDVDGEACAYNSTRADCWCLDGALAKVYGIAKCIRMTDIVKNHLGLDTMAFQWNDAMDRTHAEVLAVLKELDI